MMWLYGMEIFIKKIKYETCNELSYVLHISQTSRLPTYQNQNNRNDSVRDSMEMKT